MDIKQSILKFNRQHAESEFGPELSALRAPFRGRNSPPAAHSLLPEHGEWEGRVKF